MLDLHGEFHPQPGEPIVFTQRSSLVIVNLSLIAMPFSLHLGHRKVKNISKPCYLSEINFANCSRRSNLLIPQNEEKIEKGSQQTKKRRQEQRNAGITMWIFLTRSRDMLAAISPRSLLIVVHMNYQLPDFIMFCASLRSPKCATINLSQAKCICAPLKNDR